MNMILGFDLNGLREIGRSRWDIIAALGKDAPPSSVTDHYLIRAAELISDGADDAMVADYLIDVSTEQLGVDTGNGIRERALSLVSAIRQYLDETS